LGAESQLCMVFVRRAVNGNTCAQANRNTTFQRFDWRLIFRVNP
jgi:hypothetical protein